MSNFSNFSKLIENNFKEMSRGEIFKVDIDKDKLWQTYLNSFPEGSDPIYRKNTYHDCFCCRQFIKNIANVVSIKNGNIVTVWDNVVVGYPYNIIVEKMSELVKSKPIIGVFRTKEKKYSTEVNREIDENKNVINHHHFYCVIDNKHYTQNPEQQIGELNSKAHVFKRGLEELQYSSLETILDLIANNSLYRGSEFKGLVSAFSQLKQKYDRLNSDESRNIFIWENISNSCATFKNTVIGTLAEDISNEVEIEQAVRMFESKVAPTNYKRTSSLITKGMIDSAMKTIKELDLEKSLERRFAKISDVSVNNVLFVDNSVRESMNDGIESLLMSEIKTPTVSKGEIPIDIDSFMNEVVPNASNIEILVKNEHSNNLVSITAPINPVVNRLFKWDNNFAWSYNGNITDSIKERVKRAGGDVDALMRVSLAWFNTDDLDIQVYEPRGNKIYFSNKSGKLDVDMNARGKIVRDAVENVRWESNIKDGVYTVCVDNFTIREKIDVGFDIEIENNGVIKTYSYKKAVIGTIKVLQFDVKNSIITNITPIDKNVTSGSSSKEIWNIKTEEYVPVNTIMKSPNYWDDNSVGNKHWFFILKNCLNPEKTRGIYNEFLRNDLEKHRKVFEILGDKTKCQNSDEQLSGLGFSSTKKDSVILRVTGNNKKLTYKVTI